MRNNALLTIYLTYFGHLYGYMGSNILKNKLKIGPIPYFPLRVLGANVKESNGVGAGVSPPATLRFFTFQVLNSSILALYLRFVYLFY